MATLPTGVRGPSDGELIEAVRQGSADAYGQLYERHISAARRMARQLTNSPSEGDDLVSEAFARVLETLRDGQGPTIAFRAYLLTSLRHVAYDRTRRSRKLQLTDDVSAVAGADVSVPFTDTATADLERSLAARAFTRLPERWQTVLWHTEVEGQRPAEVAEVLGMTANGVSALAYRAREGLRQAYLQVHLGELDPHSGVRHCRATVDRLGAWTRGGLSKRETVQVETHLDGCVRCRRLAEELADVNGALRVVIAPLVLGVTAAGYLAASNTGATAVAGTTATGVAATSTTTTSSALPRQVATTAASATALVVLVTLALAATHQPEPVAAHPQTPVPTPPPSAPPAPPVKPPERTPEPPSSPVPTPGAPNLQVSAPAHPIQLVAGGAPENLPLSIRNGGNAPSGPVTTMLSLPAGVHAEMSGAPSGLFQCGQTSAGPRCTTTRGVPASESRTFPFRLRAEPNTTGGEVRATITSGDQATVKVSTIPVVVRPAPAVDAIEMSASASNHAPWLTSRIRLPIRNTGTSTGEAKAEARLPEGVYALEVSPNCAKPSQGDRVIRCSTGLKPGQSFEPTISVARLPQLPLGSGGSGSGSSSLLRSTIPVSASLGSASKSDTVEVGLTQPSSEEPPTSTEPTPSAPETSPSEEPPTSTDPPPGESGPSEPPPLVPLPLPSSLLP